MGEGDWHRQGVGKEITHNLHLSSATVERERVGEREKREKSLKDKKARRRGCRSDGGRQEAVHGRLTSDRRSRERERETNTKGYREREGSELERERNECNTGKEERESMGIAGGRHPAAQAPSLQRSC